MARAHPLRRAVKAIDSDRLPLPSRFAVFGRGPGKVGGVGAPRKGEKPFAALTEGRGNVF
jgi:hypothetical protein